MLLSTIIVNAFLEKTVQLQTECEHYVITPGPYLRGQNSIVMSVLLSPTWQVSSVPFQDARRRALSCRTAKITPDGTVRQNASQRLRMATTKGRYFVVVSALFKGQYAILDTDTSDLMPFQC